MLSDRIGGVVTMLFGAVAISESVRLYPARESLYVGDHLMPGVIGAAMILFGFIMLIKKGESFKVQFPDATALRKMLLVTVSLFAYWGLISYLGYTLSTFVISIALFKVIGSYPYAKAAIYSAVQTAVIYFIFVYWLRLPFPAGYFNF
ncbi:tripartite tricarboxylate transporter TctB family protein [Paenibacillus sp. S150]|uniref:tripartite tricarboxylate transporter TctB family protein n=1 Tax=Paenibacillus sp. S150 TaxID=2749826 RepID=UPI001C562D5E|nr:tripartite tricarboxylate transporter TctB family protein [Paenibacillus sp. S150]MBW4081220.1 tripartite tricarboxylate transporter TctB family protein [Paenibacillus sp. S150]